MLAVTTEPDGSVFWSPIATAFDVAEAKTEVVGILRRVAMALGIRVREKGDEESSEEERVSVKGSSRKRKQVEVRARGPGREVSKMLDRTSWAKVNRRRVAPSTVHMMSGIPETEEWKVPALLMDEIEVMAEETGKVPGMTEFFVALHRDTTVRLNEAWACEKERSTSDEGT